MALRPLPRPPQRRERSVGRSERRSSDVTAVAAGAAGGTGDGGGGEGGGGGGGTAARGNSKSAASHPTHALSPELGFFIRALFLEPAAPTVPSRPRRHRSTAPHPPRHRRLPFNTARTATRSYGGPCDL
jgi:hypothetical protein